jgi:acyl-CoA synthetase (NDP forming)
VITDGSALVEKIREGAAACTACAVVWMGGTNTGTEEDLLRRAGLPVLPDPTRAGRALAAWASR